MKGHNTAVTEISDTENKGANAKIANPRARMAYARGIPGAIRTAVAAKMVGTASSHCTIFQLPIHYSGHVQCTAVLRPDLSFSGLN
jgi:hypothetical protein